MTLAKLLNGVTVSKIFEMLYGQRLVTQDITVNRIQYDSRKVQTGDLFIALRGTAADGHRFVENAIERGAKVVVVEDDSVLPDAYFLHTGVIKIVVPNSRMALSLLSANYYGNPSDKLKIIGVTGTNGKTTTTYLIKSILGQSAKAGLIGTIEYLIGNDRLSATHTTPESLELNGLLAKMAEQGCKYAVMEVSSHALHQHRVNGLKFQAGIFTNLTQDHLDYHKSMEDYFLSKKILFDNLGPDAFSIVNLDDPWGNRLVGAGRSRVVTFGINNGADVRAKNLSLSTDGSSFTIVFNSREIPVTTPLIGKFNVYNILGAFAACASLGIDEIKILSSISATIAICGRFERFASPAGWTAIVDYAHTPDALEKAINAISDISGRSSRGKIITLFGCGGNRDRDKRPEMGRIATSKSDITIVTSDNPRNEDPGTIINEILAGAIPGSKVITEPDRKKAITMALGMAEDKDVVLIAGKGHEDYQIIGNTRIQMSDRELVKEYIGGKP